MKVRLWGGPGCGKIEEQHGHVGCPIYVVQVASTKLDDINEQGFPTREIPISRIEYKETGYRDSEGRRVYMCENPAEGLEERIYEAFHHFRCRHSASGPNAFRIPRVVWEDFSRNYERANLSSLRTISNVMTRTFITTWQGMQVVWGDALEMLQNAPGPVAERVHRSYPVGNYALEFNRRQVAGVMAEMDRFFGAPATASANVDEGELNDTFTAACQVMERMMGRPIQRGAGRDESDAHTSGVRALRDLIRRMEGRDPAAPTLGRARRNRTTIYAGRQFRLVMENGREMSPERRERLHGQYLQAAKNWAIQYVENSDRL